VKLFNFNGLTALVQLVMMLSVVTGGMASANSLKDVRVGVTSATQTRIVVDLDAVSEYSVSGRNSRQGVVLVDFESAKISQSKLWLARPRGHVASVKTSTSTGGQVEISLRKSAKIDKVFLIQPNATSKMYRLVIDLSDGSKAQFLASLPTPDADDRLADIIQSVTDVNRAPIPQPALKPVKAEHTTKKPVIVIDAGHGGSDPGAIGASGLKESIATLEAAKNLAALLNGTGRYVVVMTREGNARVAHEERARKAQKAKADLFISVHADAHDDRKVRGGSVYTLSEEGSVRSAREAQESGNYIVHDMNMAETDKALGSILFDVAQDHTITESSKFAEILIDHLAGVTPLLNNTHRTGNLKVLLAPDVPAVLLELAFISNAKDEANLKSKNWRKKTMGSVASAIDAYFEQGPGSRVSRARAANGAGG